MNLLRRGYKRALHYEEKGIGWKKGRTDGRYAQAKQNGPYLVRDGIKITMNDLSRTISDSEKTVSGTRFAVNVVDRFTKSIMQCFMALMF